MFGDDEMNKMAIFVDYDNVYDIIEKKYNPTNSNDIHIKFFEKTWDLFKEYEICRFIAFVDFTKINKNGLITELQKRNIKLEHCYSNGAKEEYRKNASDLALCIDVMNSIYNMDIDTYVLISSDCDMIPILRELKFKNKKTIHIYSPTCANKDIKEYEIENKWSVVSEYYTIEKILNVDIYTETNITEDEQKFNYIVNNSLKGIFNNMLAQREKENKYGFGYLVNDIQKTNSALVKEDANIIAKKFKDSKIIIALPDLITNNGKTFENFRFNKDNIYVLAFFKNEIDSNNFSDIFIESVNNT